MKKNIKITTTLILAALIAFLFTSCFDPIYGVIRTDVKPEKATVSGHNINSIARYTVDGQEYLALAANGGLRYKKADAEGHGHWATYSGLPFSLPHNDFDSGNTLGELILKVVADSDTLYLVTIEPSTKTPKIWACSEFLTKNEWKCISGSLELKPGLFSVFSNVENTAAYLRVDTVKSTTGDKTTFEHKYYTLSSTGTSEKNDIQAVEGESLPVYSAAGDKFFNSIAVAKNGTNIYYANGNDLYYGTGDGPYTKKVSAGAPILSLALTNNSIIVGTASGIKHAYLDKTTKAPGAITNNFSNNAAAQIPASYQVPCVLNATPDKDEADSQLYASVTFPGVPAGINKESDKGLWSYYPGRRNWNRE